MVVSSLEGDARVSTVESSVRGWLRAVWRTSFSCSGAFVQSWKDLQRSISREDYHDRCNGEDPSGSSGVRKIKYWNIFLYIWILTVYRFENTDYRRILLHHDVKSLTSKILVLWYSWSIDLLMCLHYRITSDFSWMSIWQWNFIYRR